MPAVNSAGIFVEYSVLTIPHFCGIMFMCLREGRNDDHPAQEGIPMKKFKITQGTKTWLFIQLENAVAVYEANQDENAKGQVFKTMEEAIFHIFAEKEDADNV